MHKFLGLLVTEIRIGAAVVVLSRQGQVPAEVVAIMYVLLAGLAHLVEEMPIMCEED